MSSDAKDPIDDQLQPQYSSDYLSAQGFTLADVENVRQIFGYIEPENAVKYKESKEHGLTIDDNDKSRKENPQKLTELSSRSHPRHLVGKRTAQKDITIDTTSDSQVNSNFPNK